MSFEQDRSAIVVAGSQEIGNAGRSEDRGIRPGVGRNVGDVGVIEWSLVHSTKIGARIKRSNQGLCGWKSGEYIARLCRDEKLSLLNRANNALLFLWTAGCQVLLEIPFAVGAETKGRMLRGEIHGLVKDAALNRDNLCLKIGVTHIQVNVRNQKQRPLLLRLDDFRKLGD